MSLALMSIFSGLFRQKKPSAAFSFRNRSEQFAFTKNRERFEGECVWAGHHNNKLILFASTIRRSGSEDALNMEQQASIANEANQALASTAPAYSIEIGP